MAEPCFREGEPGPISQYGLWVEVNAQNSQELGIECGAMGLMFLEGWGWAVDTLVVSELQGWLIGTCS